MNVGDTVTVRVHGGRDVSAKVLVVHGGPPEPGPSGITPDMFIPSGLLDVQVGALKPLTGIARSADPANPTPFTWRPS